MVNQTSAVDLIIERVYKKVKELEDAEKRGDDPDKIKAMDFSAGAAVSLFAAIASIPGRLNDGASSKQCSRCYAFCEKDATTGKWKVSFSSCWMTLFC